MTQNHPSQSFVVIGPSDILNVLQYTEIEDYKKWLNELVDVCQNKFDELYFIPDHGTYVDFALAFQKKKGPESIIAVVPHGIPWVKERAIELGAKRIHEMPNGTGWTYLNTHLVALAPHILFLGYSAGSMLEFVSSKYLKRYEDISSHFFIDERSISIRLPEEIHREIKAISYFKSKRQLERLLNEYVK